MLAKCWGIVILGFLSGFITACDTIQTAPSRGSERVEVMPVPGSRSGDGASSALLAFEFTGMQSDNDAVVCRWRIVNQDTKTSYFINFKISENAVLVALDPGLYKTGRLGCGINKVWDLDDVFKDGFHVDQGQVSYLGKLYFDFKDGELSKLRKAPRSESAEAFVNAVPLVPAANRKSFISAFTERPIDPSMVATSGKPETPDAFDVQVKGIANAGPALKPLLANLTGCSNQESASDPIRYGHLEYTAVYKDGRFSEMKDRQETNAFSDRLRSCVERGIMAFHPDLKKDVEVKVRY